MEYRFILFKFNRSCSACILSPTFYEPHDPRICLYTQSQHCEAVGRMGFATERFGFIGDV